MKKIKLSELLKRVTSNKEIYSPLLFRPSDFYKLINDPFWIWCRYYAPKEDEKEEVDRHGELQMQKGSEFEKQWLNKNYPNAIEVNKRHGIEAIEETLDLMIKGVDAIYQPHLCCLDREIYGKGDLLVKSKNASSNLGDFCYIIKEIKHSDKIRDYHKLQAGVYNLVLGIIQGFVPPEVNIVLKGTEEKVSFQEVEEDINKYLGFWQDIRDKKEKPEPAGIDKTESPWRIYANKILSENHDLTLLPDIGPANRKSIRNKLNVQNIMEIEKYSERELINLLGFDLGGKIFHYVLAYKQKKSIPKNNKIRKIPNSKKVIYFDFETSDEVHPSEAPHVYLIGLWDKEKNKFIYFLGRGKQDEERIFAEFLDYLGDLNEVCLYHWSGYEIEIIDGVINQYPKLADALRNLKTSCVDLLKVVKENYYIPVPTYSIKKVAPFLGFSWRQEEVNAYESMVLYWDWLKNPDQKIIDKVLKYNEDDCHAMVFIDTKLFDEYE